jgi:outer membrane protein assembly factor BamB
VTAFGIAVLMATAHGQVGRGGSAWLTARGDAQRTSWIRSDALISVQAMSKPGFALQWKTTLDNANRKDYGIGGGVSAPGVTLFVPMQLVTGSSNNVYAIDSDTGYLVWQRHFDAALPAVTDACPGGTLSAATRLVSAAPPAAAATPERGGGGRATQGYHSVLGQPGEGAPVEVRGGGPGRGGAAPAGGRGAAGPPNATGGAPPAGQRADAAPGRGAGQGGGFGRGAAEPIPGAPPEQVAGGGGLNRPSGVVYAISSDGVLHVMGLQSGKDLQKPAPFLPANSRWSEPIAVGTMLYTSTSGGCGGAPDAVWAIDLESESKPVVSWKSTGPIVGAIALTNDGTVIATVGRGAAADQPARIVALDGKTLQLKDWFNSPMSDEDFLIGPSIFRFGNREIVAAGTNRRIALFDAASLGGATHTQALMAAGPTDVGGLTSSSLATWQMSDAALLAPTPGSTALPMLAVTPGTRWILAPTTDGVHAYRVVDQRGRPGEPQLAPGWNWQEKSAVETPIVVNGVVFMLSHGRTASGRAGTPAMLYAYDGVTGKRLWASEKTMAAPAAPGSFWSAFGQIYVGTTDGTLYAFGFSDERH